MRVIGFDPGLTRAGYAIVEDTGGRLRPVAYGTIRAEGDDPARQLASLRARLQDAMLEHRPQAMAIERVFFNRNARTVVRVMQASGVATCLGAEHGLSVFEYGPLEMKRAVVGVGDATKAQVMFMVKRILGIDQDPDSPDAADALALAITLLHARPWAMRERLAR